jgi:hypothetical protein
MEADNKKNEIKPVASQTRIPTAPVETFAGDMAEVIGNESGAGVIKKIIHGEEENEAEKRNLSPELKKNKIFLVISFLFLALALAISAFLFVTRKPGTVAVQKQFIPLIFTDKSVSLDISGLKKDEIAQAVFKEVKNANVKAGEIEGIYLTENKQTIGLRRFSALIGSHFMPGENTPVNDNFLMGVVGNDPNVTTSGTGFFILLKTSSTTDIFGNLRAWEPNLLSDLQGFLGVNLSSTTSYLFKKNFSDGVVENKNARILYDQNGNIVVMYVFADDSSVIITDSQNAAHQVMLRLVSNQAQQ